MELLAGGIDPWKLNELKTVIEEKGRAALWYSLTTNTTIFGYCYQRPSLAYQKPISIEPSKIALSTLSVCQPRSDFFSCKAKSSNKGGTRVNHCIFAVKENLDDTIAKGLTITPVLLKKSTKFLSRTAYKTNDKMKLTDKSIIEIEFEEKRLRIKEWHNNLDCRELLSKTKFLRGATLDFYRCLLIKQDRERCIEFPGKWIPSWIHGTDFCERLSNHEKSTPSKNKFYNDNFLKDRQRVPGETNENGPKLQNVMQWF
jgi:hypothetical protein